MRFGQVFGDCNRGYDGDCDDDFGSGYLFFSIILTVFGYPDLLGTAQWVQKTLTNLF